MSESKHTIYGSLTALDREDVTRVLWTRTGELYAADAEFDRLRVGYNPRYATREQIDAYKAAENRRAVAQILAHAAIARAEGRSDE